MNSVDLLKKFMESREETLGAVLDRLKERLSTPGSTLVYRGYTPTFNDGDLCTHTWSYFGFGPGWHDDGAHFVTDDGVVLDAYMDSDELERMGIAVPEECVPLHEQDSALLGLVQIFWDDIADAVPSAKIRWASDSPRRFDVTNCEGRFYVNTEGDLCVTQDEYHCD